MEGIGSVKEVAMKIKKRNLVRGKDMKDTWSGKD